MLEMMQCARAPQSSHGTGTPQPAPDYAYCTGYDWWIMHEMSASSRTCNNNYYNDVQGVIARPTYTCTLSNNHHTCMWPAPACVPRFRRHIFLLNVKWAMSEWGKSVSKPLLQHVLPSTSTRTSMGGKSFNLPSLWAHPPKYMMLHMQVHSEIAGRVGSPSAQRQLSRPARACPLSVLFVVWGLGVFHGGWGRKTKTKEQEIHNMQVSIKILRTLSLNPCLTRAHLSNSRVSCLLLALAGKCQVYSSTSM